MSESERRIETALARNHALAERTREAGFPGPAFDALQSWQRERLAVTYADLLEEEQFRAAGRFFLDELYGGLAFRERDQQVVKVLPVMKRTMPDYMLHALARAFELQALSLDLDLAMTDCLVSRGDSGLDTAVYRDIYRQIGREADRRQQIDLIRDLGLELTRLVRRRLVMNLVRLLRLPARASGFGKLQDFLEQGLWSFRKMKDGPRFVNTVYERETVIMQGLMQGSDSPFTT